MDQQRKVIKFRAESAICVGDSSREHIYSKAKCAQQQREQTIQFIAEAAAMMVHNLCPQQYFIEDYLSPQVDVQVFKRDSQQMGLVQGSQCLYCWFK